jgi:16S rRNA (adenine1518-N6/adenine1519-N6)-dimethyltransferase
VSAIDPRPENNLIEIGPGKAAITEHLVNACPGMSIVELDRDLVTFLKAKFEHIPQLSIHSGDALSTDFSEFYDGRKLRLVGNLPYNISTPLLFHLLSVGHLIEDMHFMLQREVVDRLSASAGTKSYGRLSVMIQYHCRVLPLIPVPPSAFSPAPKVQSAVVRLKPHPVKPCIAKSEVVLSNLVNHCFQTRRKTLRNCLKPYEQYIDHLSEIVDLSKRPDQLRVSDFVAMANIINC